MQRIVPLHVVDATAGPGEKHHVGIQPVNVEVVAVKTLTRPEGAALQRTGKVRQITQFGKGLTNVQVAAVCRPVVIGFLAVGQHRLKARRRTALQRLFVLNIQLNVGIRFVPQTPDGPARFSGGRQIRAAFAAGGRVVHQQAGTGVTVKLKAACPIGFLLQRRGTLRHRLRGGLRFLLRGHQLLRFLFRCRGALFSHLRAGFRLLQTLLQRRQTRFNTCHIRLGKNRGTAGQHAYHHGKSAFFIHFVASLKITVKVLNC